MDSLDDLEIARTARARELGLVEDELHDLGRAMAPTYSARKALEQQIFETYELIPVPVPLAASGDLGRRMELQAALDHLDHDNPTWVAQKKRKLELERLRKAFEREVRKLEAQIEKLEKSTTDKGQN